MCNFSVGELNHNYRTKQKMIIIILNYHYSETMFDFEYIANIYIWYTYIDWTSMETLKFMVSKFLSQLLQKYFINLEIHEIVYFSILLIIFYFFLLNSRY